MAIVNRDVDVSEQRKTLNVSYGAVGISIQLLLTEHAVASEIQAVRVAALGVSGSPVLTFGINRFIAGTGGTVVGGGFTTLTLTSVGTSGLQTVAVGAPGNSLVQLLAGDAIQVITSGANSAVTSMVISVVVKELVDIKNQFNAF